MIDSASTVRLFDYETQQVRLIPASELAEGWMKVRIQGLDGEYWVDASKTKPSPIRHANLSPDAKARVVTLLAQFGEAFPLPVGEWEQGFLHDAHPENEIAIWEKIAAVYERVVDGRKLRVEKRRAIVLALTVFSCNGASNPTTTFSNPLLTLREVQTLAKEYERGPRP
jgi:hypothetical protein